MKGWQIPAYPLPINLQDTIIQRIVCRADLSHDMAELFIRDLKAAIKDLNNANVIVHGKETENKTYGFTH
ncbi:glutamate decarboxylase [[Clostridium] sordellii]|nr:glutamate decarboxylase [[Clostridium] sordellii] [Paeniclostridium sordellii]